MAMYPRSARKHKGRREVHLIRSRQKSILYLDPLTAQPITENKTSQIDRIVLVITDDSASIQISPNGQNQTPCDLSREEAVKLAKIINEAFPLDALGQATDDK